MRPFWHDSAWTSLIEKVESIWRVGRNDRTLHESLRRRRPEGAGASPRRCLVQPELRELHHMQRPFRHSLGCLHGVSVPYYSP